jgi:hypothetical protein
MSITLRDSTGALNFSRVTPEIIGELDEPLQHALLYLLKAHEIKTAAVERRNAATKRVYEAIADEGVKRQEYEHTSSPIPFKPIVAKLEEQLGRPLDRSEMAAAIEQHAIRVRDHRAAEARAASIAAYSSH